MSRELLNLSPDGGISPKFISEDEEFNNSTLTFASVSPCASLLACRYAHHHGLQCFSDQLKDAIMKFAFTAVNVVLNSHEPVHKALAMHALVKLFLSRDDSALLVKSLLEDADL